MSMATSGQGDVYDRLRARLDEFPLRLPLGKGIMEILRLVFTPQEAEMLCRFTSFQRYMTVQEFAREHGYPEQVVEQVFYSLANRDLMAYRKRGEKEEFCLRPFVVGMFEGLFCNWRAQDPDILVPLAAHVEDYFTGTFYKALSTRGFPWARVVPAMLPLERLRARDPTTFGSPDNAIEVKDAFEKSQALVKYAGKELPKRVAREGIGGAIKMIGEDGAVALDTFSRAVSSFLGAVFSQAQGKAPRQAPRTIPIDHAVPVSLQVHPHEEIRRYIEEASAITVGDCACRKHQAILQYPRPDAMDSKCGHPISDTCMQLFYDGYEATEYNSLGGRPVSKREALDIIEACERNGLVHTSFNAKEKIEFICNCCPCCCGILGTVTRVNQRNGAFVASNFLPFVDTKACVSCGTCARACPVTAIRVEQGAKPAIDGTRCIGCGLCAVACAKGAMHMVKQKDAEPALDTVDAHLRFATQKH